MPAPPFLPFPGIVPGPSRPPQSFATHPIAAPAVAESSGPRGVPTEVTASVLANRAPNRAAGLANRRLVAREGFEPSKALGRQIYSLLRLTAPQPRRTTDRVGTRWNSESGAATRPRTHQVPCTTSGAGEGIRTPDRLITNQLLYRTELRQPDKGGECSTRPGSATRPRAVPRRPADARQRRSRQPVSLS